MSQTYLEYAENEGNGIEELTFWKIWSNVRVEEVCIVTGDTPMNEFEEETLTALRNLFDNVNTLRQIAIRDMLIPETYQLYEESLQAAYDALTTVEDALASLGMKLEYEHWRLGGAVEELEPLMLHIPSASEKVMELFEENMHDTTWQIESAEPMSE
jgi:hypothetical protein